MEAVKRRDYAEAARRFRAAIELDPSNAPAYLNLGDVRYYQGDVESAIAMLAPYVKSGRFRPFDGPTELVPGVRA